MESISKRTLALTLLSFLIVSPLFAEVATTSPASEVTDEAASSSAIAPTSLEKAQQLEKEGKYLDAQKLYEGILKEGGLDKATNKRIQKSYEALNIKLLFSKAVIPGSSLYTVQPGDNLTNIAKKNKTTVDLIRKSNEIQGDKIRAGQKLKVVNGTFAVRVDKSRNILLLYLDGKLLKHYRVATGSESATPPGEYKIINKIESPAWFKTGEVIPGGSKKNALGTRWMGFDNPGYGIHGTTAPESIGKTTTSGCVRMLNKDVEELFMIVPMGTKVKIVD